jgi:hypothetical protein
MQPLFTAFATVAFFKLVIFSIFEMRYLLLIWKARRSQVRPQNIACTHTVCIQTRGTHTLYSYSALMRSYTALLYTQNFNTGWNAMQRELTVLYSRFYCTLLVGLVVVYNFWSHLSLLILAAYSFWVP